MTVAFQHTFTNITWVASLGYAASNYIGYNDVVYLLPLATNALPGTATGIGSHASVYYTYSSKADVVANVATLSAIAYSALKAHFAKNKGKAHVIAVDVVGTDDYDDILDLFITNVTDNFFSVNVLTRTSAHIVACANLLSTLEPKRLVVTLSADSTLIGDSTAFNAGTFGTTFANKLYLALMYDSSTSSINDVLWWSKFLSYDPDLTPTAATLNLYGDATLPTFTARGAFDNVLSHNVNVPGTLGPAEFFIRPGTTLAGSQITASMTRFMLHKKIVRAMDQYYVNRAEAGTPIAADETDQRKVAGLIEAIILDYVRIGRIASYTKELVPIATNDTEYTIIFEVDYKEGLEALNIKMVEV